MIRVMRVQGRSMEPTLRAGQLVLVNGCAFHARAPRRGEVVAARLRALGGRALVKRVVGLPHDRVALNGGERRLGTEEFFLLGDQPDDSLDSRRFGPVKREELIGPVRPPWK